MKTDLFFYIFFVYLTNVKLFSQAFCCKDILTFRSLQELSADN